MKERLHGFAQRFRLLIAGGDHNKRPLGQLPQQHRVKRLCRGGETGKGRQRLLQGRTLQQFLKCWMAGESRKQVANCRMNQGINARE